MNAAKAPLQSLLWPDPALCTERELYVGLEGAAVLSMPEREIRFAPGGSASFATYANLFNVGKWHKYCGLDQLSLDLTGTGTFELVVFHAYPDHSWTRLINDVITLKNGVAERFDIRPKDGFQSRGLVFFELRALSDGRLNGADWCTKSAPRRTPELMLSITTFKREAAVQATVARFEEFITDSPLKDHIHLTVVDNGQSVDIAETSRVTVIANENLGGAGGFARGLMAARARGASHCLFMDDDAANHSGALERTWMFLAHARDTKVAISGALSNAQYRWQMWENGAIFDKLCHPQFSGLDLREPRAVIEMELQNTDDKPANFYGGWWYFAFAVDHALHMPFPFFVRGDDISFSLMNDFSIVTLPGVISFQNENFSSKESPLTLYLDVRGHVAHHLVSPQLDIGRKGITRILAWFFVRSFLSCHYETLSALNLSLRDAIEGPDFFARNADMAARRADIKALMDEEVWRDLDGEAPGEKRRFNPENFLHRLVMKATLNGHLLPGFARFGNHITLPSAKRGARRPIWGASRITYVSPDLNRAYTVRHNKKRAWREAWAYLSLVRVMWRDYDAIRARWQADYDDLTTGPFWEEILKIESPKAGDT